MERSSIQSGMLVRDPGGRVIGRVLGCSADHLVLRRRWPFRTRPVAALPLGSVTSLSRGQVHASGPLVPVERAHGPWMSVLPLDPRPPARPAKQAR